MKIKNIPLAGLVVASFAVCVAVNANAELPVNPDVVATGAYRCPGNFVGFQHSITFNTSDSGNLSVETEFTNLDTGDCTPRGHDAMALAQKLGCTTGPQYAFQRGGGIGAAFGFVCRGKRSQMLDVIEQLSKEILRPTTQ